MVAPFVQKIEAKAGFANTSGSGSPEDIVVGWEGQTYRNNDNLDLYEKAIGNGTPTGWVQKSGAGAGSTPIVDNLTSSSTVSALSANQGRILNETKEPAFSKNSAFNKDFGNISGTVTQGNDARLPVKRLNIFIASSPFSNKKGVSFSYGTTISDPFFSLSITSGNNNDAFTVKVINITTTSAYLEVYRADGAGGWDDFDVRCFITIYSGTY